MAPQTASANRLHYELVRGLLDSDACPSNSELAQRLRVPEPQIEDQLRELTSLHGVVLHPHICEPWIIHPFSLTPALNYVQSANGGWWAPCIWCAFGVAALAGGCVEIHARLAGETSPLVVQVRDGEPAAADLVVHFAIPPRRAWDNVHQHCGLVLPFRNADEIGPWCGRHRQPEGEAVPIAQVARLAKLWYGRHADADWRKWTVAEAQQIFTQAALVSPFWDLGAQTGRF